MLPLIEGKPFDAETQRKAELKLKRFKPVLIFALRLCASALAF